MSSPSSIQIQLSHRGTSHSLTLSSGATLATLKSEISSLTNVPPTNQKLLYKGKKPAHSNDEENVTLEQAGFKDGFKVQMLGNTEEELGGMRKVEDEQKRRERIMAERMAKGTVKVRFYFRQSDYSLSDVRNSLGPLNGFLDLQHLHLPSSRPPPPSP